MQDEVIYRIPAPYTHDRWIEVYGEPEMVSYEFRIVDAVGVVVGRDTGTELNDGGMGYGCAEIALRDALIEMTSDKTAGIRESKRKWPS